MNRKYKVINGEVVSESIEGKREERAEKKTHKRKPKSKNNVTAEMPAGINDPLGIYSTIRTMIRQEVATGVSEAFAEQIVIIEKLINKKNNSKQIDLGPRTYTISQVCEILKCSEPTYYRIARKGVLKTIKRGRTTLIMADDFDRKLVNNYFLHIV